MVPILGFILNVSRVDGYPTSLFFRALSMSAYTELVPDPEQPIIVIAAVNVVLPWST